MNPIVAALLVGAMTTLGRWSRGKSLTVDTVVGVVGVAVGLAVVDQMNKQLARGLGALVVIGVAVAHAPAVLEGFSGGVRPGSGASPLSPRVAERGGR